MSKPLNANISKIFASFNDVEQIVSLRNPIPGFRGKPLYCHPTSQSGVLTIQIDETPQDSVVLTNPAQAADITIAVGAAPSVQVHLAQIDFPGNKIVSLVVKLTPQLDQAFLFISDTQRQKQQDDIDFGYILVQEASADQLYRVEFVVPPLVVGKDEEDTSARLIPADHSQQPGVIGPMGIEMP